MARSQISIVDAEGWREAAAGAAAGLPPGAAPGFVEAAAASLEGAKAVAAVIKTPKGRIGIPVVIQGGIGQAMPFGMPAGPVVLEGEPAPISPGALRRELDVAELIATVHHTRAGDYPRRAANQATHVVRLGVDEPRKGYRQRARRKLKAAEGAEIEVRRGSAADGDRLIEILAAAAEDAGRALYPDPEVTRAVAAIDEAVLLFATRDGAEVSAALFLGSPLELFYWQGGTMPAAEEHSPSYAVIDAGARLAAERGCEFLNLGSSEGLPGVAHFKEGFGAEEVSYPSFSIRSLRYRLRQIRSR